MKRIKKGYNKFIMPDFAKEDLKEDLRVKKTRKSLQNAMATLLEKRSFKAITVNELCNEALTSRAAFYAHFKDKYDLLEYYLGALAFEAFQKGATAETVGDLIVFSPSKRVKNIMESADDDTSQIVHGFVASLLASLLLKPDAKEGREYKLLEDFCVGGIMAVALRAGGKAAQETKKHFAEILKHIAAIAAVVKE